jgi:hypothetical protein
VLLYALAKFVAYSAWCGVGLHLLTGRASLVGAFRFGAVRWLLGLAFGLVAGVALGSVDASAVTRLYFGVYIPLRAIEWSIMAVLLTRGMTTQPPLLRSPVAWLWVIGGMLVSFASDLASPEGMAGRFCVGRCLC